MLFLCFVFEVVVWFWFCFFFIGFVLLNSPLGISYFTAQLWDLQFLEWLGVPAGFICRCFTCILIESLRLWCASPQTIDSPLFNLGFKKGLREAASNTSGRYLISVLQKLGFLCRTDKRARSIWPLPRPHKKKGPQIVLDSLIQILLYRSSASGIKLLHHF